ncbi:MAG: hypothetical protein IT337_08705 [Thermomicrobiales bacterium]|nr:hypothetical protein [Thermomicrobiales bacterium]
MNERARLQRLAGFLYGFSAVMFAGAMLELLAARHFAELMQLVPFALCAVGLAVTLLAWRRPSRNAIGALRLTMPVIIIASLIGVWEHIEGNIGFIREMRPNTAGWDLAVGALTGRAPLLASGALAATAVVAVAATYAAGWELPFRFARRSAAPAGSHPASSRSPV